MGAIAGIYGAIAIGMLAAWFGGTATQISGPTGPMTVVSAVVIATEIEMYGSLSAAMGNIIAIFLLAGIIQILLGVLKVGQYIRYMPYPVVSGFMSGIGVIIIVLQFFHF
jgi:SulP family sulfate permease